MGRKVLTRGNRFDQRNIVRCPVCEEGVISESAYNLTIRCDHCEFKTKLDTLLNRDEMRGQMDGPKMTALLEQMLRDHEIV